MLGAPPVGIQWRRHASYRCVITSQVVNLLDDTQPAATQTQPSTSSSEWKNVVSAYGRSGEPNGRELEPDDCLAEAAGRAPRRGVNLTLRCFRFRQTQEYENGAVERFHFFEGH